MNNTLNKSTRPLRHVPPFLHKILFIACITSGAFKKTVLTAAARPKIAAQSASLQARAWAKADTQTKVELIEFQKNIIFYLNSNQSHISPESSAFLQQLFTDNSKKSIAHAKKNGLYRRWQELSKNLIADTISMPLFEAFIRDYFLSADCLKGITTTHPLLTQHIFIAQLKISLFVYFIKSVTIPEKIPPLLKVLPTANDPKPLKLQEELNERLFNATLLGDEELVREYLIKGADILALPQKTSIVKKHFTKHGYPPLYTETSTIFDIAQVQKDRFPGVAHCFAVQKKINEEKKSIELKELLAQKDKKRSDRLGRKKERDAEEERKKQLAHTIHYMHAAAPSAGISFSRAKLITTSSSSPKFTRDWIRLDYNSSELRKIETQRESARLQTILQKIRANNKKTIQLLSKRWIIEEIERKRVTARARELQTIVQKIRANNKKTITARLLRATTEIDLRNIDEIMRVIEKMGLPV